MPEIEWIDPREFQEAGFLQEANRLFFHPHGLALAVSVAKEEAAYTFALTEAQVDRLRALIADDEDLSAVLSDRDRVKRYDIGDSYFSGCWDARHDPEGVILGPWSERDHEKASRVAAEREKHREARTAMFGADTDVEPLGWEAPDA